MILEIAEFKIKPWEEQAFMEHVAAGIEIFRRAKGCEAVELRHSPEAPGEYRLLVRWTRLENHVVDFRESADFPVWRNLIAPHFVEPPVIRNWTRAVSGFGF